MGNNYVVIMAGGIGSRFWPMSKTERPKQFLDILGTGKSLLQMTFERFSQNVPPSNIFIVTNYSYRNLVLEHLPKIEENNILEEPVAKNTAPCILYALMRIQRMNPNANCLIAPSDHLITKEIVFLDLLTKGFDFVEKNNSLLTIGIEPFRPDTGYGYIQYKQNDDTIFKSVKTFTEKPDLKTAQKFIDSGDFLWNSGMFFWNVKNGLEDFQNYLPELYDLFDGIKNKLNTKDESHAINEVYPKCQSISVDFGIVEKAKDVYVMPADFGWSDLGTWKSLMEISPKDKNGNFVLAKNCITDEVNDCLIVSDNDKIIAVKNVKGLYIINTDDALLIIDKENEQDVKKIVNKVKTHFNDSFN